MELDERELEREIHQEISRHLVTETVPCEDPEYGLAYRVHLEDYVRAHKN